MASYSPKTLVLTLSRRCNIDCGHCIVESEPRSTESLGTDLIDSSLSQGKSIGIDSVVIYGGEPFLHIRDLLPYTIHQAFKEGFSIVSIGTNGFWGRTEAQAQHILSVLNTLAGDYNGDLSIGLSVDQYHQPKIPPQSIANIISVHRKGDFGHIRLGVHSFKEQPSFDVIGTVYDASEKNGVHLIESNDQGYIYPALLTEFIRFSQENYPKIAQHLELPTTSGETELLTSIALNLKAAKAMNYLVSPTVIARQIDIGQGLDYYLVFPQQQYLLDFIVDKVLNAGRARKSGVLETGPGDTKNDYLVIAPNGQAYAYPAHISAEPGIIIGTKPLHQVATEVGHKWFN